YEGVFKGTSSLKDTFTPAQNVIDERGISLTQTWYPVIDTLSYYNLSVILPEGYEALSEAEEIIKTKKKETVEFNFTFSHPVDKIHLIASNKYKIIKDSFKHVQIYAYFFQEDLNLAQMYLEFTKKYLQLYENLLGKYPYKRFSIVENFLPRGYSMPTFTLLGNTVVRLPFIVETSLGHEILHQWFGNLIYVDYQSGNWAEGLTTYLADHLYHEQQDRGWEFRKQMLVDYKSYVTTHNEFPLNKFVFGADPASKAIGYGKVSLTFHMLKKIVGEKKFFNALKYFIKEYRFKMASWDDLRISFERVHGESLERFFRQWLDVKGMPQLSLKNVKVRHLSGSFELNFHIIQKGVI
ncbi:MAG: M1 family peptidase, partial [Thermodesulfovibrionia bacterium]|nr:M1 family peptidase [Thermodesulfovibrionia bacterium]